MQTTDTLLNWLEQYSTLLPWIGVLLVAGWLATWIIIITLNLIDARRLTKQKYVFLELTPPAQKDKSPSATRQLFAVLHGLEGSRTISQKLLRQKVSFSLEIVANREKGIRYIACVAEGEEQTFRRALLSYLPSAKIEPTNDFLPFNLTYKSVRLLDFKQTGSFAYPLNTQVSLDQQDPIAYLTGAMTKLKSGELMALQVVTSPTKVRQATTISRRIMHNEDLLYKLGKNRMAFLGSVTGLISDLFSNILDGIGYAVSGIPSSSAHSVNTAHRQQVDAKIKPARSVTPLEQQLAFSVNDKLSQPLFSTSIRTVIVVDKETESQRVRGVKDWAAAFNVPKYQALKARLTILSWVRRYRLFAFTHRIPVTFQRNACLLSASELADIYHFPHSETAETENVVKSLSKTLPAPVSLKSGKQLDIVLANNHHHGETTPIGLTAAERERHVFMVGGTGNGKTTLLEYGLVQDIQNGKGIAVVDPHGDMAFKLLKHVPESRINDVVYFNPDDLSYPIGLNMLELPPDLAGDDLLRAKDLVTESVVSVFRKIFSDDDSGGHRVEYVLRNAIHTALTVEDSTLFTIYDLLNNPDYRKRVVSRVKDKNLVNFWKHEMGKAGGMQQVKMMAGITSKIGRFLFSASAKRILEQSKSTINVDEILNGKILICNFSKGLIGDDTSELFGIAILAKLQLAALRRARIPQSERKPFYLYVDEFQNFATESFVQMLSEARKYKLFLTMAEQSTSQQDDQKIVDTIFANAGTLICFRSGSPTDEQYFLPRLKPVAEGEIAALPSYNFYMRIAAIESQEAFSGETIVLEDEGDEEMRERVIVASRKNYAKEYVEPEKEVAEPPRKEEKAKAVRKPRATGKQKYTQKSVTTEKQHPKPLLPKKDQLKK